MIARGADIKAHGHAAGRRRVLGVPIDPLTMAGVLDQIDRVISHRERLLIGVVNAAKLVNMRHDGPLREAVLSSDVILADGMAVVWASRLLKQTLPARIAGIDLMHAMLRRGSERGYRIFCLGATNEVLAAAVERIRSDHPGVVIAGQRNGYFRAEEEPDIVRQIRASRPDILFAAMSPPKKEQFLAKWVSELEVPVCHGVGGAFDVLAGKTKRAPEGWQRAGLEWLYRVVQEPRRLWRRYLVTNTLFCTMVASEMIHGFGGAERGCSGNGSVGARGPRGAGIGTASARREVPATGQAPAKRMGHRVAPEHGWCIETITQRSGFDALRAEWGELLSQSPARAIFLTWDWIAAWLNTVAPNVELHVVVVRDTAGRVAAIGPFYRCRLTLMRLLPYRWLRVLGDPRGGSEYPSVIARRDVSEAATRAVLQHLLVGPQRCDGIWFPNMGPDAVALAEHREAASAVGYSCRTREVSFSRIRLPESFDAYLGSLPGKIRYQVRRGMERVQREQGAVLTTCQSLEQLDPMLADLHRLHQTRWNIRGKPGIFADSRMTAFYREVGGRMLEGGRLRLDALHVAGRAVASQIGFEYAGTFYELQRGFDSDFPNVPAGLGSALRSMVIRRCIEAGTRTYDFLGGFTDDKQRAGAERSLGGDLLIIRPGPTTAILARWDLWPTGRYLRFRERQT